LWKGYNYEYSILSKKHLLSADRFRLFCREALMIKNIEGSAASPETSAPQTAKGLFYDRNFESSF